MMTILLLALFVILGLFGLVWSIRTDSFETFLGWMFIIVFFSTIAIVSVCCSVGWL